MKTERLPCELTDDEVRAKGEQIAQLIGEIQDAEVAMKAQAEEAKDNIKGLKARTSALSSEVRTRREYRSVEVRESFDWGNRRVEVIRLDTGEVIRTRETTEAERQLHLSVVTRERPEQNDDEPSHSLMRDVADQVNAGALDIIGEGGDRLTVTATLDGH